MNESFKTEKIIIEYPSYRKEVEISFLGEKVEIKEYCEVINGDICYFKKEKDSVFRVYRRKDSEMFFRFDSSGKKVYPTSLE